MTAKHDRNKSIAELLIEAETLRMELREVQAEVERKKAENTALKAIIEGVRK